jgi:small subunit ribosomal protein S18
MYPAKSKPAGRPGPRREGGRGGHYKRKSCRFCANKEGIDFKNTAQLRNFVTERGKILPRRITGNCARHQRAVIRAVKRARTIALLPYATS